MVETTNTREFTDGPSPDADIEALRAWAESHAGGLITVLPHDPERYPHQHPDVVHIPANISEENSTFAHNLAFAAMGEESYLRFVGELKLSGGLDEMVDRLRRGENTLVATGHLQDTLDTALSHNLVGAALPDRNRNIVLANHIMKFMAIAGTPVTEVLSYSGPVFLAIPAKGAATHGVSSELVEETFRKMAPALKKALSGNGVVFHRALTGGRATTEADGSRRLPKVEPEIIPGILKRTNRVIGMPMNVHIGNTSAAIMEARTLSSEEDIHKFMSDMASVLGQLSGEKVVYG